MTCLYRIPFAATMLCFALSDGAFAQVRSMGPMPISPQPISKAASEPASMLLSAAMPASQQVKATLNSAAVAKSSTVQGESRSKREIIGAARLISPQARRIDLGQLVFHPLADGSQAARVRIDVEGATSVRLAYRFYGGIDASQIRLSGSASEQVQSGRDPQFDSAFAWSDVFDGNALILDVKLPAGQSAVGRGIVIEQALGLDVRSDLSSVIPKRESDIGTSQSCEIDVACVANPSQALRDVSRAVAKILVVDAAGLASRCSASLIANAAGKPYLITGNHCVGSQGEANSIVSYWQFEASTCGNRAIPSYQRITDGARLLFADARIDVTLTEMYSSPPSTALLAGWTAAALRRGAAVTALHHPNGDLKKYSSGTGNGYVNLRSVLGVDNPLAVLPGDQTTSFYNVRWTQGSTEGGSSGSPLYTREAPGAVCGSECYLFRGTLAQGDASCSNTAGFDEYTRFDLAYPYIAQFIDPAGAPKAMDGTIATEYYNTTNDHYFITAYPEEAAGLDQAATRKSGWFRTGEQFGVWRAATAGRSPVCRFFGDLAIGGPNSHFYTSDAGECSAVAAPRSGWSRESADAFRVAQPTGGVCPAGTQPIYRVFNYHNTPTYRNTLTGQLGFDSNHRYFTQLSTFDLMAEKDSWAAEISAGRTPIMCGRI